MLLIQKTFTHIHLQSIVPTELRVMLDTAMEILFDLDGGSKTIMRCRDNLARLLAAVDSNGMCIALSEDNIPYLL